MNTFDYKVTLPSIVVVEAEETALVTSQQMPQDSWINAGDIELTPPTGERWHIVGVTFKRTIAVSGGAQIPWTFLLWDDDELNPNLTTLEQSIAPGYGTGVDKETSDEVNKLVAPGETRELRIYFGSEDADDASAITITNVEVDIAIMVYHPTEPITETIQ